MVAGLVAHRLLIEDGVMVPSSRAPMISVGTRTLDRFCENEAGARGMAALRVGRRMAALMAPPPPME